MLRKYRIKNEKSAVNDYWNYRAVAFETANLDVQAKHMAAHNTPYSSGCIRGMLKDICDGIKEILLKGKKVKIGELDIFYICVSCKMAEKEKNLTVNENVKTINFNAMSTG